MLLVSGICNAPAVTISPCSVIGPLLWLAAWNSLPDYLPRSLDSFRRDLKTFLVLLAYAVH